MKSISAATVAASAALAVLVPHAAAAADSSPRCDVPPVVSRTDAPVRATAERVTSAGTLRTDYFDDPTTYRTTQCAADGAFLRSMVVGEIAGPDGHPTPVQLELAEPAGVGYSIAYSTYADPGSPLGARTWAAGSASASSRRARLLPAVGRHGHRQRARSGPLAFAAADTGCSETAYSTIRAWGTRSHNYRINLGTIPASIPGDSEQRLVSGHHAWNQTSNPCGLNDVTDYSAAYAGSTGAGAPVQDGTSATTFRLISGLSCYQTGVIACTYLYPASSALDEADQVYGQTQPWWAGTGDPTTAYYDLFSVAVHESGHELGLAHVSSAYLSMGPTTCAGCVRQRDLGRGDVLGMRALYP